MIFLILFILIHPVALKAMAPDGVHTIEDYRTLGFEKPEFDAACLVVHQSQGVQQTGVLVDSRIVLTTAHGLEKIFPQIRRSDRKNGFILFDSPGLKVFFEKKSSPPVNINVQKIIVDERYFEYEALSSRQGRYDFAFLILDSTPQNIKPATIEDRHEMHPHTLLTVISYGVSDIPDRMLLRRGFHLFERDQYVNTQRLSDSIQDGSSAQQSSLFFQPFFAQRPSNQNEGMLRAWEATQNWQLYGKGPYGLALPGTSGAPVFARIGNKEKLLGIITSFSKIDGDPLSKDSMTEVARILSNISRAQNYYQTIFALLYRVFSRAELDKTTFVKDPQTSNLLFNACLCRDTLPPKKPSFLEKLWLRLSNLFHIFFLIA